MSRGYVHDYVLLNPIEQKALQLGATVDCEAAIRVGGRVSYGDLLIQVGSSKWILVEAELSSRRVLNDLAKAAALGACELWVVVPNPTVAKSVYRKLSQHDTQPRFSRLFVLLLPQALQRLAELFE